MGVSGFTPFLQKTCPAVFKQLPNRIQALEGKRIVIDGTLITQRFHFASHSHPHNHVWGWYRLAHELKKHNVSAICVFDGAHRAAAKREELMKRQAARDLAHSRGAIEDARFKRLNDLKGAITRLQELDESTRQNVIGILKSSDFGAGDRSAAIMDNEISEKQASDVALPDVSDAKIPPPMPPTPSVPPAPSIPPATSIPLTTSIPPDTSIPPATSIPQSPDTIELAKSLTSLHLGYQTNLSKLLTLSTDPLSTEVEVEKAETKKQHQLTIDEGELWEKLESAFHQPHFEVPSTAGESVGELLDKSFVMAASFQRRNNAPTAKTFADSKAILTAMGIPCIDATGADEAEALASAIVLGGHADYVASEDTDVIAYEAPLIRNITSLNDPFVLISGSDVRTELNLTREQFVDMVLLMGTDFSQRITSLGPVRAYNFIKKHGSIENVLDAIEDDPKFALKVSREAYLAQIQIARLVFSTLPTVPSQEQMKPLEQKDEKVKALLDKFAIKMIPDDPNGPSLAGNEFDDKPCTSA